MSLSASHSPIVLKIGNILFFIFLLILMLDPGGSVLHMKDKVFLLIVGYNALFLKPDLRFLVPILAIYSVVLFGYIIAEIQENPIDYEYLVGTIKGISPIILLLWVKHYNLLHLARIPAVITCIVILILYGFIASSPIIQYAVFLYSKEHNEMVMITTRNILGFKVFGMYYRSIVCIILLLYCFLYTLHQRHFKSPTYLVGSLILVATFMISGTRAMMLTPIFVLGIILFRSISTQRKARYFLYPVLGVLAILFIVLIALLATQEGDKSNMMKYGHLYSYVELFSEHPHYLLWGQGCGTMFYSLGFHKMTPQTEWIYIELLRNYGLLSLIIIGVYAFPLVIFYKYRHDIFTAGFAVTYFGFLLIAGTNPFLLNSQGMTVLWLVYSHVIRLTDSPSPPLLKAT